LDYPKPKLEIIVVSDGSTDGTVDIVRSFEKDGVRLLVQAERLGKTAALNWGIEQASGEVIVFSDANSSFERNAVRNLARNLGDSRVGYVTGKMLYVNEEGSLIGSGCSSYMRYENALRSLETRMGSIVGVDGGIDAVRKSLYDVMDPDMLPDFVLPLRVVEKGYRVVYEEEAIVKEPTLSRFGDEWRMRVRVTLRSLHALWSMKSLLSPCQYGAYALQLFIHKVVRYMVGFFLVGVFLGSLVLSPTNEFYALCTLLQIGFYATALTGWLLERLGKKGGMFRYPYYFCLVNAAAVWAFVKFLRGERLVVWTPRKG
jgi:cellulose synthase/poly-beta-1,6-N-acetylglucosamine synthase-like glycosyltransferase